MKKISLFLATVMFFLAVAVMPGSVQEVQAFSNSEINWDEYEVYRSGKAGAGIYMYFNMKEPSEGMQIGLVPKESKDIKDAVCLWNVESDTWTECTDSNMSGYMQISKSFVLEKDIPEGEYNAYLYDADGNIRDVNEFSQKFINMAIINFNFSNYDDEYVYGYVYNSSIPVGYTMDAENCPVLYDDDQQTPVTSYDAVKVIINETEGGWYGEKVTVYRLKPTVAGKITSDVGSMYYKNHNSSIGQSLMNSNNMSVAGIFNPAEFAEDGKVTIPFDKNDMPATPSEDQKPDNGNTNPDDTKQDDTNKDDTTTPDSTPSTPSNSNQNAGSSSTASTPAKPEFVVSALADSSVSEVQTSINSINQLVGEIQTSPADLVNTLKAYAPDVKFSTVTSGGTLDITEKNGVDISGGTQVTFTDDKIAANVTSKDTVIVLHVKHDGTIERVSAVAGDGTITATFTSLSPVAWFKVSNAEKTTSVSPKTGEHFWSFLFH